MIPARTWIPLFASARAASLLAPTAASDMNTQAPLLTGKKVLCTEGVGIALLGVSIYALFLKPYIAIAPRKHGTKKVVIVQTLSGFVGRSRTKLASTMSPTARVARGENYTQLTISCVGGGGWSKHEDSSTRAQHKKQLPSSSWIIRSDRPADRPADRPTGWAFTSPRGS